ncbi:unnamed protein product [Ceutorhynchus assimilis]|uniref:MICOS complex subunit MIC60 n=1 Tax=Ceutorhynchus assimilis TaxID=467358 RepID=A0A9N9QGG4_9CUCU|nr:unnamed protein product [Ceutorhynchus assimilis]
MSISILENNSKSPTHIATDWNFFLNEVLTERVQITPYYDKEDWKIGEIYSMRVSHIYDPSHFWVVTKHLEMDLLHRYLNDFYSKHNNHYKLPEENLKLNLYCVVYTEGAYYRGILVKIPYMMKNKTWVFVYLLDFGFMSKVLPDNIYFMTKDMYSVKHFAIRACLAGIGPLGTNKWTSEAVIKFTEIITNKVVYGQVIVKNDPQKVLFLQVCEYNSSTESMVSIGDTLVDYELAKKMTILEIREMKHSEKKKGLKESTKGKLHGFLVTSKDAYSLSFHQAPILWSSSQSLLQVLKKQSTPGVLWIDQIKPLHNEISALVNSIPRNDEFAKFIVQSIPKEARERGVCPEESLKKRFRDVEKLAMKLDLVPAEGGSLSVYILSCLQSILIIQSAVRIPQSELDDDEVNFSQLTTHEVLYRAKFWLDRDNLLQTLKYVNLLKGASRKILIDYWLISAFEVVQPTIQRPKTAPQPKTTTRS